MKRDVLLPELRGGFRSDGHFRPPIDGLSTSKGLSSPFAINGDFSSGRLWPWRLHSSAMVSTAGVVDGRHALFACLVADVSGFIAAVAACHFFFG